MISFIFNENELEDLSLYLIENYKDSKVFTLEGDLGAGKTSFVKSFCKILNISEEVSSPTFSLVNQYKSDNEEVCHMDLYRVNSEDELIDFGFEEYFFEPGYLFIEWPGIAESLIDSIADSRIHIHISVLENNIRKFSIEKV